MSRTIVAKLTAPAGDALHEELAGAGYAPHNNPNAAWALRGEGVVVNFYGSGKCVVQGAGADRFADRYLPDIEAPDQPELERLDGDLIGTDESGKGDYFGPLVAAAVLVPKGQEKVLFEIGVRDSKVLSDAAAREIAKTIRDGYPHAIVEIGPPRYNELYDSFQNLNKLLAWATAKAVAEILNEHPCENVLSDKFGNERLIRDALAKQGISLNLVQRVRAESNPAVAAASILARDRFLAGLARLGKQAGTKLPKGAGAPVLSAARRIYQDGGLDALRGIAKMHFKTTQQVAGELF
jgi:ribonuclease HIII